MTPDERRARTHELTADIRAACAAYEAECAVIDRDALARKAAARAPLNAAQEAKGRHIIEQYGGIRGFIQSGDQS